MKTLYIRETNGRYKVAAPAVVLDAARVAIDTLHQRGECMTDPAACRKFVAIKLAGLEREVFSMLALDNQHRLIDYVELAYGTINEASVYPREVLKSIMALNCGAVVFAHNHPSGVAEPSWADRALTRRLKDALALIDVRVLDHFVVGGNDTVSFAERGWL